MMCGTTQPLTPAAHTVRTTGIWHRMCLICPPVFFFAVLGVPALPRVSQSRGLRYVEVYICTWGKRCNAYRILLHTLMLQLVAVA